MIDYQGYVKLVDLGTAKILSNNRARTYTIIGTPHYMAPEVLVSKGYSYPVDLWSLGVCLFEFLVGKLPFGDTKEDPFEIYEEIQSEGLSFPKFIKDE